MAQNVSTIFSPIILNMNYFSIGGTTLKAEKAGQVAN